MASGKAPMHSMAESSSANSNHSIDMASCTLYHRPHPLTEDTVAIIKHWRRKFARSPTLGVNRPFGLYTLFDNDLNVQEVMRWSFWHGEEDHMPLLAVCLHSTMLQRSNLYPHEDRIFGQLSERMSDYQQEQFGTDRTSIWMKEVSVFNTVMQLSSQGYRCGFSGTRLPDILLELTPDCSRDALEMLLRGLKEADDLVEKPYRTFLQYDTLPRKESYTDMWRMPASRLYDARRSRVFLQAHNDVVMEDWSQSRLSIDYFRNKVLAAEAKLLKQDEDSAAEAKSLKKDEDSAAGAKLLKKDEHRRASSFKAQAKKYSSFGSSSKRKRN